MAYNGWSNYETWAIKLWMDNELEDAERWANITSYLMDNPPTGNEFLAADRRLVHALAEQVKDWHQDALPEIDGFAADLLNASFGEINWYEIAESLIADANEAAEYERLNA